MFLETPCCEYFEYIRRKIYLLKNDAPDNKFTSRQYDIFHKLSIDTTESPSWAASPLSIFIAPEALILIETAQDFYVLEL